MSPRCATCILRIHAGYLGELLGGGGLCELLPRLLDVLHEILDEVGDDVPPVVPASMLLRWVKGVVDVDPYFHELCLRELSEALKAYEALKSRLSSLPRSARLREVVKVVVAANSLDFSQYRLASSPMEVVEMAEGVKLAVDDTWILEDVEGLEIAYLLDNTGEAVLDRLLAEELRARGARVIGVVKSLSAGNDAYSGITREAGLDESFDELVETGSDALSVVRGMVSEEVWRLLGRVDLVIAKGMAHYEYLSEANLGRPVLFMLRAKCPVVAGELGVAVGDYVAKAVGLEEGVVRRKKC